MLERSQEIDSKKLVESIIKVSEDRGTISNLSSYQDIKKELKNSKIFNENFKRYKNVQYPQSNVSLEDIFAVFDDIHDYILLYWK